MYLYDRDIRKSTCYNSHGPEFSAVQVHIGAWSPLFKSGTWKQSDFLCISALYRTLTRIKNISIVFILFASQRQYRLLTDSSPSLTMGVDAPCNFYMRGVGTPHKFMSETPNLCITSLKVCFLQKQHFLWGPVQEASSAVSEKFVSVSGMLFKILRKKLYY